MSSTSADPTRPVPADPPHAAPVPPPPAAPLRTRLIAEAGGTFWLVLCGCGTAVMAATYKDGLGVGLLGVALAFGLAVLTAAYAVGHISGGHFNPAVTVGLAIARRFEWRSVAPYVITQVIAATAAGAVLFVIAHGKAGFDPGAGFASNGYGERSPGGYSLAAGLIAEVVFTAVFVYIILSVTDDQAPKGFGPLAIGLTLTAIHLVSIPVTNTSVNPARSIGVAWFAGAGALSQLWLFILAPLIGAAISGLIYSAASGNKPDYQPQARTAWSTVRRTN